MDKFIINELDEELNEELSIDRQILTMGSDNDELDYELDDELFYQRELVNSCTFNDVENIVNDKDQFNNILNVMIQKFKISANNNTLNTHDGLKDMYDSVFSTLNIDIDDNILSMISTHMFNYVQTSGISLNALTQKLNENSEEQVMEMVLPLSSMEVLGKIKPLIEPLFNDINSYIVERTRILDQEFNSDNPPATKEVIDHLKESLYDDDNSSSNSQLSDDQLDSCSICLNPFKSQDHIINLECNHYYHTLCIKTWLSIHNQCALCRKEVS